MNSVFEVTPQGEVARVQVWAASRPVKSLIESRGITQTENTAVEVLIDEVEQRLGPVWRCAILHEAVAVSAGCTLNDWDELIPVISGRSIYTRTRGTVRGLKKDDQETQSGSNRPRCALPMRLTCHKLQLTKPISLMPSPCGYDHRRGSYGLGPKVGVALIFGGPISRQP